MFEIKPAKRQGAKIVLALAGVSGGGKTYTALQLAYGLANRRADKIGFLDTENRRALLYADELPEPFLHGDFPAPFSPSRYIEAIQKFEKAGVEVLVIDSGSHEWEGTGGCEEIATAGNPKFPRWNLAKAEHKKFMNVLLQSSMHVIVCLRARDKVKVGIENGKSVVESLGLQPICEKNMMFEMTASLMIHDEGKRQDVLKCPAAIRHIVGRGNDYLNVADGEALRAWIDGAAPIDRELERYRATLVNTCEQGLKALEAAWLTLPKAAQRKLKSELDGLKASAASYDEHRKTTTESSGAGIADGLNAELESEKTDGGKVGLTRPNAANNAAEHAEHEQHQHKDETETPDDGDVFATA